MTRKPRPKTRPEDRPASLLLLDVRTELDLGAADVAMLLGVTKRTVERWSTGGAEPSALIRHILTDTAARRHFLLEARLVRGADRNEGSGSP